MGNSRNRCIAYRRHRCRRCGVPANPPRSRRVSPHPCPSGAISATAHAGSLNGQNQIVVVLAVEKRHQSLFAGKSLVDEQVLLVVTHRISDVDRFKMHTSPSKITEFPGGGYTCHKPWKEKGTPIKTKGRNKDYYPIIGTCIHDIFAIYRQGCDNDNRNKALSLIGGYGLLNILAGHVDAVLRSADRFSTTFLKMRATAFATNIRLINPVEATLSKVWLSVIIKNFCVPQF